MAKTIIEMQAEIDALKAKLSSKSKLCLKIGKKMGISVYGLNVRFPVTLYAGQWERLIAFIPEVQAFIEAHHDELAWKE
jgi:hypothetical protein